jgi:plastocyanin
MKLPILLASAALAAALAACAGGGSAASATPPPDAAATITASDSSFQERDVTVPAGEAFRLFFRNLDGQPHNVAIYEDDSAASPLFVGANVTDAATTYEVPSLPAGDWFFRCDVHPDMRGTIHAGPGA